MTYSEDIFDVIVIGAGPLGAVASAFNPDDEYESFDFSEKFSSGWGTTFQVQRAQFDKILAYEARKQGVKICFGHALAGFKSDEHKVSLSALDETGNS